MRAYRLIALALAGTLTLVALHAAGAAPAAPSRGELLYRQGVLPSGKPLHGERDQGVGLDGSAAACVICHRRSGYGSSEGTVRIPPITGAFLFNPSGKHPLDTQPGAGYTPGRGAYSDETLARAIREGVAPTGRTLGYVMPRYHLDDATMASLIAYLKGLSATVSPGVTADTLHFATIITPDADLLARQGMLDVLQRFIEDKNDFRKGGGRPLQRNVGFNYRVTRNWQLHVWQLTGPAEGWEKQLQARLASEPVFAVLSGLGGKNWAPVHRFCEHAQLPCLFPNVDLPVIAERDFYSVYFTKGVVLEAQLIAKDLAEQGKGWGVHRIVQVYREGDIGQDAAQALVAATSGMGWATLNHVIRAGAAERGSLALNEVAADDVLVLWLRPQELSALPGEPARAAAVFASGLMGGLENAPVPDAWRDNVRITYPADLPEGRAVRMHIPLAWFKVRNIPVVAERVQADTYLACGIVAEQLTEMLDRFVREVLIERIETMLNTRLFTGYYARLGLAQGQRFAAKGGYVARFAEGGGTRLVADGGYIVP